MNEQPSCRAASPMAALSVKGSSTVPPGRHPAAIQRSGNLIGTAPLDGDAGMVHTSPGFLPAGWAAACRCPVGSIAAPCRLRQFSAAVPYFPLPRRRVCRLPGRRRALAQPRLLPAEPRQGQRFVLMPFQTPRLRLPPRQAKHFAKVYLSSFVCFHLEGRPHALSEPFSDRPERSCLPGSYVYLPYTKQGRPGPVGRPAVPS